MRNLFVDVIGTPAPQGSKRGFVVNNRVVMAESSKKVKPWRQDVKAAALDAIATHLVDHQTQLWAPMDGPVSLIVTFYLPRPRYHYGTGKNSHALKPSAPRHVDKKPDIDKLLRSTLDALGEAGVWRDDSQVAAILAAKDYATDRAPGAQITITPLNAVAALTSTPSVATAQVALL